MTTPGGTISASQINTEIGRPSNQSMNLNDGTVRALANKPSGTISYNDCRNKSFRISATGGTTFTSGGYRIHVFTSPGNLVVSQDGANQSIEYYVVAGGAGASRGGGGAGGMRSGSLTASVTTYPVNVGGGGAGRTGPQGPGTNGANSRFGPIVSTGGGGGGGGGASTPQNARPGG